MGARGQRDATVGDYNRPMIDWLKQHETLMWALGALSVVTFVLGLALTPYVVARLPVDYFCRPARGQVPWANRHPVLRFGLRAGKNALGLVLALAAIPMLVLPGPGLITLLIGIMLLDFPGKYALERWLVAHGPVFNTLNWMRRKAGREPLILHPAD